MSDREIPFFEPFLGPYLVRQDWAQALIGRYGAVTVPTGVVDVEVLRRGRPGLASVIVEAEGQMFHLVLGWRDISSERGVRGGIGSVLGPGEDRDGEVLVYDAHCDPELVSELLLVATEGRERAERSRSVRSLVSHSAIIFDERLFMKSYRVIEAGRRPEVETALRLVEVGFERMSAPVGHWSRHGRDLALVREFIPGAVEGKALAETSLRDLLARAGAGNGAAAFEDVGLAGGDLGAEMLRLGAMTAEMHLALAEAFGRSPSGEIRVHGDYHLRRIMRTDSGWKVTGFGDDPLFGTEAGGPSTRRPVLASPMEDLADLCFSLRQTAAVAVSLCTAGTRPHALLLAEGWERHNVSSLLSGYLSFPGIGALVTEDPAELDARVRELVEARATGRETARA